ncbi:MAG: subtype I-B CRISPR-associated endonuclease Cas1 [Caldiserica bacterium]|nr:MAG: subtype I-B CRISPR-associated endonuclease Cas1 [Caldisericota bacterium]
MKKRIFVFSNGEVKRRQNTLYFELEDGTKKYIPVENTGEFYFFGEVTINKKLFEFLNQNEIIVHFFNHFGYYIGSFYPREHYNSGYMILKQAEFYNTQEKRIKLAKLFTEGAIANILKVLNYYNNRGVDLSSLIGNIEDLSKNIENITNIEELMAIEGNIRQIYYKSFNKILGSPDFEFDERTKRPPENELNALISFGNSLLYVAILSEIYKTHLDPRIGFLHTTNFRRFSLNLDIAEIFKPVIVDRIIFTLINKRMIQKKHFEEKVGGIYLKENGRRIFVEEFDRRLKTTIQHPKIKRKVSYQTILRMELYKLEKHLIGEEKYRPFISSW